MSNKIKVDMHIHTTASDGTWTLEELLQQINDKEIKVFSITDHDRIMNSVKMLDMVPEGIEFHVGAEISCTYRDKEYHITAYDFDINHEGLLDLLQDNLERRLSFNEKIVAYTMSIGKIESMDDFADYEFDGKRGGWKSINYLIDKGIISSLSEYFQLIIESQEELIFRHPQEVIDIIKSAGGYAIMAHPSAYVDEGTLDLEILKKWKAYGISGIECYSPYLEKIEDADYYVQFCQENNLMISAGSDCHGDFAGRSLGVPEVYIDQVKLDFIRRD